ncbi:MAG: GNAT family N-acetyltransferase [Hyphomicrobiales bacterium]|nr:GNAT family N-acetyltransferase [Hyphomicrobiales bacterium]
MIVVVPAGRKDFDALRRIELAAFETLRAAGAVAGPAAASSDAELQRYLDAGLLFAAYYHETRDPIGYGGGYETGGWLHVGEVDVRPDWQRRGVGRRLMEAFIGEGLARELLGTTLTTDRLAPFNAAFYAKLGFRPIEADDACPEHLKAALEVEVAKGLDAHRRIAMVLAR